MDKYNKIHVFFIVLALLAWNPLSYYLFYTGTGIETSKILIAFVSVVFLSGLFAVWWIVRNGAGERFKNITLLFSFSVLLFCGAVLADRIFGKIYDAKIQKDIGIVGIPNTSARYKTIEYDIVHRYNNIGICDRDVNIKKDKFRILCFGDSWTMGDGVNIDDSWPKKLEVLLRQKDLDIEVLNCGQVGMYPAIYRQAICKALPLLKPDMIIVGVLQFEDLAQEYEYNYKLPEQIEVPLPIFERIGFAMSQFTHISFRNFSDRRQSNRNSALDIRSIWAHDVNDMLRHANQLQKLRYAYYDDSIRQLMQSGNFNSVLISYYLNFPERKFIFNNPHNRATIFAAEQLLKDVQGMRGTCDSFNCKMVFVNLPYADFTGHEVFRIPELDQFNNVLCDNNHIDSIYRYVASRANVPYLELTDKFQALEDKKAYFYRYDNHPNRKGYNEIAKIISDSLVQYINQE